MAFRLTIEERGTTIQQTGSIPQPQPIRGEGQFRLGTVLGPDFDGIWLGDPINGTMSFDMRSLSFRRPATEARIYQGQLTSSSGDSPTRWEGGFGILVDDAIGIGRVTLPALVIQGEWTATTPDVVGFESRCSQSPPDICSLLIGRWQITAADPDFTGRLGIASVTPSNLPSGGFALDGELELPHGLVRFTRDQASFNSSDQPPFNLFFGFQPFLRDKFYSGNLIPGQPPRGDGRFGPIKPLAEADDWSAQKLP